MEQYKHCGNGPGDDSVLQDDERVGASTSGFVDDQTNCLDGKQCPDFRKCSSVNVDENGEKGY